MSCLKNKFIEHRKKQMVLHYRKETWLPQKPIQIQHLNIHIA